MSTPRLTLILVSLALGACAHGPLGAHPPLAGDRPHASSAAPGAHGGHEAPPAPKGGHEAPPAPKDGGMRMEMKMMASPAEAMICPGSRLAPLERLDLLRRRLELTPDQAPLFNSVVKALADMRALGRDHGGHGEAPLLTVSERLRRHETMMETHLQVLKRLRTALDALSASLSEEQRRSMEQGVCEVEG